MTGLFEIAATLLGLFAAGCFRLSRWHHHEAGFWWEMQRLHILGIAPDDAPALLAWAQSNPPSLAARLRGWKAPHVRRSMAGAHSPAASS